MESRKTRYSKYRQDIKDAAEGSSVFQKPAPADKKALLEAEPVGQFNPDEISASDSNRIPPYQVYLRHRQTMTLIKTVVLILLAIFFAIWAYLLFRR